MIRTARSRLAVLALLLAVPAAAEQTRPGTTNTGRHDSNAPVDFDADRIEVQDRDHKATLIGNVHAVQGEMTLTADRVVALYQGNLADAGGSGTAAAPAASGAQPKPKVQRLDASGHVVVTRPGEIAHGDYGIYDLQTKLVTLIGNVTLDRNGSVVRGGRLVVDQNSNRATVDGAAVGGAGAAGKGGRVSGRFIVDDSNSQVPAGK